MIIRKGLILLKKKISGEAFKKALALLLCVIMAFGFSGCNLIGMTGMITDVLLNQGTQEEFEELVETMAVESAESSYMTTHIMMENPEDYGVDKSLCPLELSPHFDDSTWEESKESLEYMKSELERYNPETLSDDMQAIYYYLEFYIDSSLRLSQDEFRYYGCAFESISGIHAQLPSILSEWDFRSEQDIKDLIEIIRDIPAYIDSLIDYTEIQVSRKEWTGDAQEVTDYCQDIIDQGEDCSMLQGMLNNIKKVDLTEEQLDQYTKEITEVYNDCIIPAYQSIIDEMKSIDESVQPRSIWELEYGQEYYEALFYSQTSVDEDIDDIVRELNSLRQQILYQLQMIIYENPQLATTLGEDITTGFSSYEEIIEYLKGRYQEDFPAIDFPDYVADPLEEDMEVEGVAAYFVIPALDQSSPMKIRVNTSSQSDVSSASTFTTIAHEGVPGHMYQTAYSYENLSPWANILCGFTGYTEGYATYVELYSLQYLSDVEGISDDDLNFLRLYNMYDYFTVAYLDIQVNYHGMTLEEMAAELGYSVNDAETLQPVYDQLVYNPGIFLPYYIGFLEFYQLREDAQQALGSKFDDKSFHEAILKSGSVPFNAVEQNVEEYISSKQFAAA